MCTEYLAEDYKHCFDEQAETYINHVINSIDRMYLLIEDLLTYSRVGKQESNYSAIDLNSLIRETLEDLSLTIAEKQAVINYNNLPTIKANPREIRQLFQNLISNALKFSSDRPTEINIDAQKQDNNWLVKVRDNGIGIEPQYADKIFQMFQRLHHSSEYEGTGIGLAICHKVITSHGGNIWVESKLGEGSTFYFTLLD